MACPSDNSHLKSFSNPIKQINQDPPPNIQALISCDYTKMCCKLIKVLGIVNGTKSLCARIAMQAGFNSADETALGGKILMLGGLALGASGVVQGVGNFEQAKGVAKATKIRNHDLEILDKELEEKFKSKDLSQDTTLEVKAIDEPCSHVSDIKDASDVEEALADKQAKLKDQEEKIQEVKSSEKARIDKERKNKRIKLINKNYEIRTDSSKAKASKLQAAGTPGQAAYYAAQGWSELKKAESQKENLLQQVQEDNQNQQANTAEAIKKEIDKLAEFNPFQRNSSSQR
jgi:hypothetical protein